MDRLSLLKAFEARLDQALPVPSKKYSQVFEAARYSLFSGGKRLRPLLILTAAYALSNSLKTDPERAFIPACAIEMIHTYSLIHDDLPAMDNDDLRRGKPTLHRAYPEGQAILAGDLLLTSAFEVLATADGYTSDERIAMITLMAKKAGGEGMIGGQSLDLSGLATTQLELDLLHRLKTGALIEASLELAAIASKAPQEIREALGRFGAHLGLAFQIIDDVLDLSHPDNQHGLSSDEQNDKLTYITLIGKERSEKAAEHLLSLAVKELDQLNYQLDDLKQLAKHLVYRQT